MKDIFFGVTKFLVAFCLIPVVIASTNAFQDQLTGFRPSLRHSLWLGFVGYTGIFFFVHSLENLYRFGQTIVRIWFQFLRPLVDFTPYVVPIYTLIVLVAYSVLNVLGKMGDPWQGYFFFAMAFTFGMHMVLTARELYGQDSELFKPTYFFSIVLIYIVNVFFIGILMHMMQTGFSFPEFFKVLARGAFHMYKTVFEQLF